MIDRFVDRYRFLSNLYPAVVTLGDEEYPSVEHAYQAAKTLDLLKRRMIRRAVNAATAKKLGRLLTPLRPNWNTAKLEVMETLVREKFTRHHDLGKLLLLTGYEELIEGNYWGDTFWGVCNGKGQNHLGKILMRVRAELRSTYPIDRD